jgi:hypothetical protein
VFVAAARTIIPPIGSVDRRMLLLLIEHHHHGRQG